MQCNLGRGRFESNGIEPRVAVPDASLLIPGGTGKAHPACTFVYSNALLKSVPPDFGSVIVLMRRHFIIEFDSDANYVFETPEEGVTI